MSASWRFAYYCVLMCIDDVHPENHSPYLVLQRVQVTRSLLGQTSHKPHSNFTFIKVSWLCSLVLAAKPCAHPCFTDQHCMHDSAGSYQSHQDSSWRVHCITPLQFCLDDGETPSSAYTNEMTLHMAEGFIICLLYHMCYLSYLPPIISASYDICFLASGAVRSAYLCTSQSMLGLQTAPEVSSGPQAQGRLGICPLESPLRLLQPPRQLFK